MDAIPLRQQSCPRALWSKSSGRQGQPTLCAGGEWNSVSRHEDHLLTRPKHGVFVGMPAANVRHQMPSATAHLQETQEE